MNKPAQFLIYALLDPRTGECRYVGLSTCGLRRPRQHRAPSSAKANLEKVAWLQELRRLGRSFEIVTLYSSQVREGLAQAEMYWIAEMKQRGSRLTNRSAGGFGTAATSEMKARMSESARKAWADPVNRAKHMEIFQAPGHVAAMSLRGQRLAQDPAWREANLEQVHLLHEIQRQRLASDPAYREEVVARARATLSDPGWRQAHAEGVARRTRDPEWRRNVAAGVRGWASDPVWKKNHDEANARAFADPATKARHAERFLARMKGPEFVRRKREGTARRWADPSKRAAHVAMLKTRVRQVESIDPQTGEVREYESGVAASAATGASRTKIAACARGRTKTAAGLHWQYLAQQS